MDERLLTNTKKRKEPFTFRDVESLDVSGKKPPQAVELEEAILGALMLDKDALRDSMALLKHQHFYSPVNETLFEAMIDLYAENKPVDILTLTEKLRSKGTLESAGGPIYLARLTSRVSSAANIEYHIHIVIEKFIQREMIRISGKAIKDAYDETIDAFQLLDETEKNLYEVKNDGMKKSYQSISDVMSEAMSLIEKNADSKDGVTGVPSGLSTLDEITSGWQKSDLVILAARPGMGKTALALTMLRNAAVDFHKPVAIFSLEMSAAQLVTRLISAEAGISSEKLKKGNLEAHEWTQLHTKITKLSKAQIFIDDTPALPIFELKAKCRRLHSNHNIELVVIDYLQLMRGEEGNKNGNREQEISYISRSLKGLAKELNIPIIALAQLSRAVEQRAEKTPQLSDLRESGSLEQDADIVGFIFRPDYYKLSEGDQYNNEQGYSQIIIAKHRNGRTDNANVKFVSELGKFQNLDDNTFENAYENDVPLMRTVGSKMNEEDDLPSFPKKDDDAPWNSDTGANIIEPEKDPFS
ncbi:MAG: replicative DNA helicase [Bacteroidia bacterium]|nr:replicative DNA helicase [Bacteroidia bacterium]